MSTSMTGYGRGESQGEKYSFVVEAKSVNNRYLEVFVKLPKTINYLEDHIKQTLKSYVSRGKVEIFVKLTTVASSESNVTVDLELAQNYKELILKLDEKLGLNAPLRSIDIIKLPDVIKLTEAELDKEELLHNLNEAMKMCFAELKAMRLHEGQQLKEDVLSRCEILNRTILSIEERAANIEQEQRDRLISKMTDLLAKFNFTIDEQRVVQEAAVLADKANVTEEIVRFKSHIEQLSSTAELKGEPVGRKLDFILQEMNREVNTIGSKSVTSEITDYVIDLKSELEKIREQVQNVE